MRATPKARLEALKTRYVSTPNNQQLGDAASSGKEDVMNLILSHFHDLVTQKNSLEDTPLHEAIRNERLNATRMLIFLRTDLDIMYWKNKDGILKENIDRLSTLLHVKGEDRATPLHPATSVGNVEAVQLLLSKCSYLALQTEKNGYYLIHIACEGGSIDIIHELMKMWPNVAEMKNRKGQKNNAVHHILKECSEPIIEKLVNSKDVDGNTPLHLASMNNHCQVMLSLVRNKRSDVKLLNNNKMTALDVALNPQSWKMQTFCYHEKVLEQASHLVPNGSRTRLTLLLVATLVATVTFTAGFTLPGGYNASSDQHPGTATMLHNRVFQVFVITDKSAMYSSILAAVGLSWGHSNDSKLAEEAYLSAGLLLLLALVFMMVAFCAAVTVAVSKLI
ncbi:protein ACCELERATED CELL DEATH 6 [Eucalyptus grandis]|uniref:protein ACCELERATED CELL DEATH 6 n=1 Tax=Eucalyptus grandis TaxID=71139 RepID=UPI00192EB76D|nr:protein ACCELERATED CELL DEATH 6 [Eucalyptus grandis]